MKSQYKLLVDKAYLMHQNGELEKAESLYSKLLEINPDDANVLNLFGLLSVSMKKYERAISLLSKAFLCNKSSYVAENLAKATPFQPKGVAFLVKSCHNTYICKGKGTAPWQRSP